MIAFVFAISLSAPITDFLQYQGTARDIISGNTTGATSIQVQPGGGVTHDLDPFYGGRMIVREALTGDCTAAQGSNTLTCSGIAAATAAVSALSSTVSSHTSSISTLQSTSSTHTGQIATLQSDVTTLQSALGTFPVTESFVAQGSAVSVSSGGVATITSISLSPGTYEISAQAMLTGALTGGLLFSAAITSAGSGMPTQAAEGGRFRMSTPTLSLLNSDAPLSVGPQRVVVASTTTYFLRATATFTLGTGGVYGQLRAVKLL